MCTAVRCGCWFACRLMGLFCSLFSAHRGSCTHSPPPLSWFIPRLRYPIPFHAPMTRRPMFHGSPPHASYPFLQSLLSNFVFVLVLLHAGALPRSAGGTLRVDGIRHRQARGKPKSPRTRSRPAALPCLVIQSRGCTSKVERGRSVCCGPGVRGRLRAARAGAAETGHEPRRALRCVEGLRR